MKRLILPLNLTTYWAWLRRSYSPLEAVRIHGESTIVLAPEALYGYRDLELWILPGALNRPEEAQILQLAEDRNLTVIFKSEN